MPIALDFDRIASLFRPTFRLQLLPMSRLVARLGPALAARLRAAQLLERQTRGFPSIRFYNDAVTTLVDRSQWKKLEPVVPPPSGAQATFAAAGKSFVEGLSWAVSAVEQERTLPRFVDAVRKVVAEIEASIAKFQKPTAALFDAKDRRAFDLFGEAALAFRVLGTSTGQIRGFGRQVNAATKIMGIDLPSPSKPGGEELPDKLERYARYILGAVLVVPAMPRLIALFGPAEIVRNELDLLGKLASVEVRVYGLRRQVFDYLFVDVPKLLLNGSRFLLVTQLSVALNIGFFADFGRVLLLELAIFVDVVSQDVQRFIGLVIRAWITSIMMAFHDIADLDLIPIIARKVPYVPNSLSAFLLRGYTGMDLLRVRDLVGPNQAQIQKGLLEFIDDIDERVSIVPIAHIALAKKFRLARRLVRQGLSPTVTLVPQTGPPTIDPFTDISTIFVGGVLPALGKQFEALGDRAQTEVVGIFLSGQDALTGVAYTSEVATNLAVFSMPKGPLLTEQRRAASLADRLVGGQQLDILIDQATRGADPLAKAYEAWLAQGGFSTLAAALPVYVDEMERYLERRTGQEDVVLKLHQTSPHILAKRAKLTRVKVKELTIVAHSRSLDPDLVEICAEQFRANVGEAWLRGKKRLTEVAGGG